MHVLVIIWGQGVQGIERTGPKQRKMYTRGWFKYKLLVQIQTSLIVIIFSKNQICPFAERLPT